MASSALSRVLQPLKFVVALVVALFPAYAGVAVGWLTLSLLGQFLWLPLALLISFSAGFWVFTRVSLEQYRALLALVVRLTGTDRIGSIAADWVETVAPQVWRGGKAGAVTVGTLLALVVATGAWKVADPQPIFLSIAAAAVLVLVIAKLLDELPDEVKAAVGR